MPPALTDDDLADLNARFEREPAEAVVAWAAETFARADGTYDMVAAAAMTSDVVLVDLVARVAPGTEVVFLDTGYHFPETLTLRHEVEGRYPIRLHVTTPVDPVVDQWRTDTDACCNSRKVVPLARALDGRAAWITGVRRADSPLRADTPIVQRDRAGRIKVNPIATWTDDDLALYAQLHDVPRHALLDEGYPSIGCWPCTRRVEAGEHSRAGRWSGSAKTECGLHV